MGTGITRFGLDRDDRLAISDFNRDGVPDVVTVNRGAQTSELVVLLGIGDGSLAIAPTRTPTGTFSRTPTYTPTPTFHLQPDPHADTHLDPNPSTHAYADTGPRCSPADLLLRRPESPD